MPIITYVDVETGDTLERVGSRKKTHSPIVTFPQGHDIQSIEGAVPGSEGTVRIKYKPADEKRWKKLAWQRVDRTRDYSCQFELNELISGHPYEVVIEARSTGRSRPAASIRGSFSTAPAAETESEVNFIVTTGTSYPDVDSEKGYKFYSSALKLDPDFFVHTGDIVYYDGLGKTAELARWHWDRMYSYPNNIEFHRQVTSYFIKDDHDTWMNDCYPGMESSFMGEFTYEQGTRIFLEEVPMGAITYRTIRWGKDLQIWLMEGRDFRSPNPMPDGPEKTIWGAEQIAWLKSTVEASDASFKVLISPTPIVGPDRTSKKDNHANAAFAYEGKMIREFISQQENMIVVCGDRHWQYVSKDMETGVLEFSCGPGSDAHAGGWSNDQKLPEHIYLNVTGGFLEGSVNRINETPVLTFRHYSPDGELYNEFMLE
jgi:alkaline phosphatase D